MVSGQFIQHPVHPAMHTTDCEQPGFPWLQYTTLESGISERLAVLYLLRQHLEGDALVPG
jgi:hypothetical protein